MLITRNTAGHPQARFTEALLKEKAKVDFSADRIFSTTVSGQPKSEVLQELEQKHPGTQYHFVEDKLGTLDKVSVVVASSPGEASPFGLDLCCNYSLRLTCTPFHHEFSTLMLQEQRLHLQLAAVWPSERSKKHKS